MLGNHQLIKKKNIMGKKIVKKEDIKKEVIKVQESKVVVEPIDHLHEQGENDLIG